MLQFGPVVVSVAGCVQVGLEFYTSMFRLSWVGYSLARVAACICAAGPEFCNSETLFFYQTSMDPLP